MELARIRYVGGQLVKVVNEVWVVGDSPSDFDGNRRNPSRWAPNDVYGPGNCWEINRTS